MSNHRRPVEKIGGSKYGNQLRAAREAPSSLVPAGASGGANESTRHTAVSRSWLEKQKRKKGAPFAKGKPGPDSLTPPRGDETETFFETMTTCRLPKDPAKADDTLIGMPVVQDDQIIDCRNEEDSVGLPLGWRDGRAASPSSMPYHEPIFSTTFGPPGQGLPKGASLSSASSEPSLQKPDSGLRDGQRPDSGLGDEKTKEIFPPKLDVPMRVSHADVLRKDTWGDSMDEAPTRALGAQNPKRTIFGIPVSRKH